MSVQPNPKLGIDPESGAFSLDNLVTQLEAAQKARQNALGMVEQAEADILKARAVRGLTNALLGNSRTRDESAYLLSMLYRHDEEIDPNEFNIAPIVRRLEIAEKILGYKSDSGEKRFSLEQAADIANKVTSVARVDIQSVTGIVEFYLEVLKKVKLDDGKEILAHLAGRLRMYRIKILPGDKVTVELTPYDDKRGRIVYRGK